MHHSVPVQHRHPGGDLGEQVQGGRHGKGPGGEPLPEAAPVSPVEHRVGPSVRQFPHHAYPDQPVVLHPA